MRQPADAGDVLERLDALLKFEVPQILLDYVGHRHTQGRRKVLRRHCVLLVGICQNPIETIG